MSELTDSIVTKLICMYISEIINLEHCTLCLYSGLICTCDFDFQIPLLVCTDGKKQCLLRVYI